MNIINKTGSMIQVDIEDYGIKKPKESIQTKLKASSVIPAHNLVQNASYLFL